MVDKVKVRLYVYKGRHSINLPSEFVKDSTFPFTANEELVAQINGRKVVIEKTGKKGRGA